MNHQQYQRPQEPWLAVVLSSIFPGLGQIYAGARVRGGIFALLAIGLIGLAGWSIIHPNGQTLLGAALLCIYVILAIANLFDAHRCARQTNSDEFTSIRKQEKDPWLAVFLSRIIPGLGHAYQGQWFIGIGFFTLIIMAAVLSALNAIFALVAIGLSIVCAYHVYTTSPAQRIKSRQLIIGVCLLFLIVDLTRQLLPARELLESRYIPSGSMEPTLQVNDRLIINKFTYRANPPDRGDIVVFWPTENLLAQQPGLTDAFISRIIGLPGDTVHVTAGSVYVNGQALNEPYIAAAPAYEWGPETLPTEQYFVLGDNRNNSYDSHYWGFVSRDHIFGKATKIWWPPSRSGAIAPAVP